MSKKPELLAPAGDLEKLKVAVRYGADAVYIGGSAFSLRARAKNFTPEEMRAGIRFAHEHGAKVYAAANIFARDSDFDGLSAYFKTARDMGADALIISDPGVFALARETVPGMDIHISTQANNTNARGALFWHGLGAKRIVLARELSLKEIAAIRANTPDTLALEAFVHGAVCVSYSGRCLLSSFLSGRDANRGACAQPCRWGYRLTESKRPGEYFDITEEDGITYIMNAKDLCMLAHIPALAAAGITSFKIEGRVKSAYYVGTVVRAYRMAIDAYHQAPAAYQNGVASYLEEVEKASHRGFTTGFYFHEPGTGDYEYGTSAYIRGYDFIGMVLSYDARTGMALVEQRNKFAVGDEAEFLRHAGPVFTQRLETMADEDGTPVAEAPHAQQRVWVKTDEAVAAFDMMRRAKLAGG